MISLLNTPFVISALLFGIISIVLLIIVVMMHLKLKKFLIGIDSDHIGKSLDSVSADLKELQAFRTGMEEYLTEVERRLKKSIQSVETVRFNPFKGTGGGSNQSFSTAFLTEQGDGVIISSLYSREHVSVFSKPVKKHTSEFELSEEEKESLEGAKKGLK